MLKNKCETIRDEMFFAAVNKLMKAGHVETHAFHLASFPSIILHYSSTRSKKAFACCTSALVPVRELIFSPLEG